MRSIKGPPMRFRYLETRPSRGSTSTRGPDLRSSRTDRGSLPCCHIRLTARKPPPPSYPRQLKSLGDHIRKQRLDLGLLQTDVAHEFGVDEMTVCNWEINRTSPQLRFIPKIIAFLGYSPYDTQCGTLGKRIVACRCVLGLSQKELAYRLGVDPATLGRWERDEGRPTRTQLEVLIVLLAGQALSQRVP